MNYHQWIENEFLEKANLVIRENLANDQFGVSEMSREMAMSRASLYRKIKASTGITCSEFIREVKLGVAMDLLKSSTMSITEIALESGFSSLAYFDLCFKDHFGYSPGKYRKRMLAENRSLAGSKEVLFQSYDQNTNVRPINELHKFPIPVNSFIGRKEEMKIISELLLNYRVVSLVGAGGCGKTRLACEVVTHLNQKFDDGIWFVDLAPLENEEFLVREILSVLNIPETGQEPMIETLVRKLTDLKCLIILDNCEHMVNESARIASRLSQSANGVKILVTSRVVLNVKGEMVWRVPNLSLEDPDKVTTAEQAYRSEAVQLFTERGKLADPGFILSDNNSRDTADICKRLEGIPLAIELVSSRIRYMEPGTMLRRLAGSFREIEANDPGTVDRHLSMNAAIGWSFNLLLEEEKLLVKRISVFSGGFDLEAAEKICSDGTLPVKYILQLLSNLVDHSLINTVRNPGQPLRYTMLETIRDYSSGLLEKTEWNRLRKKHAGFFISVAERAYQERFRSRSYGIGRLNIENDNILAALNWTEDHNRTKYRLLAGFMGWYWVRTGQVSLARNTFDKLNNDRAAKNETRARIIAGYSWAYAGDYSLMPVLLKNAKRVIAIWRRLGNKDEESIATADLANVALTMGENEYSLEIARRAMELALIENDAGVVLYCLSSLSQALVNLKRCNEVLPLLQKKLELAKQLDNLHEKFGGHHNMGDCAAIQGKYHIAEKEYAKGLEATVQSGDIHYQATELMGIAIAASGLGRKVKALKLAGAANERAKTIGSMSPEMLPLEFWQELIQEHIQGTREKLGEELSRKYEAEGAAMELEEAVAYALDFERD